MWHILVDFVPCCCTSQLQRFQVAILFPKCNSSVVELERENAQLKEEIEQLKQRLNDLEVINGCKLMLVLVFLSCCSLLVFNSGSVFIFCF